MAWHACEVGPNVQASAASVGTVCRRICDSSVSGSIPPWISSLSRLKSLYAMHRPQQRLPRRWLPPHLSGFAMLAATYLRINCEARSLRGWPHCASSLFCASPRSLSATVLALQRTIRFVTAALRRSGFAATSTQTVSAERCHRPSASCSIWRTCTLRAACVSQPAAVADAPLWQRGVPEHARRDYP